MIDPLPPWLLAFKLSKKPLLPLLPEVEDVTTVELQPENKSLLGVPRGTYRGSVRRYVRTVLTLRTALGVETPKRALVTCAGVYFGF